MYFCADFGSNFVRGLFTDICRIVYYFLILFFEIFERIGSARLVSDHDTQSLFTKISLLLGIFMIFRLSFAFIQYIINPDEMSDKTKGIGNVVKRVVLSVVLLVTTPMLFNMTYKVQNLVIEKQIISKIILGSDSDSGDRSSDATRIAGNLFFAFFRPADGIATEDDRDRYELMKTCYINGCDDDDLAVLSDKNRKGWKKEIGSFHNIRNYVNEPNQGKILTGFSDYEYDLDALGIAGLGIGVFAAYIILTYTIQVAIRAIQLAYLQIIAPIPIMMYMTPKGDETLKKWFKQCTTTFFDFFIRCAILYFSINVINVIISSLENSANGATLWTGNIIKDAYILVILIIAIFAFAKKAPKLLQEIFPMAGGAAGFDYGINLKKAYADSGAGKFFHTVGGAAGGFTSNIIHNALNARKNYADNYRRAEERYLEQGLSTPGAARRARRDALLRTTQHGLNSAIGGFFGGGRAGLSAKTTGEAIRMSNANRKKREQRRESGYRPILDGIPDKAFWGLAGEKTNAARRLKEAQWRQESLNATKSMLWERVYDDGISTDSYQFLRSFKRDKERNGNITWSYNDQITGERISFTMSAADADAEMERRIRGTQMHDQTGGVITDADKINRFVDSVRRSASTEESIKKQGDIIEALNAENQKVNK